PQSQPLRGYAPRTRTHIAPRARGTRVPLDQGTSMANGFRRWAVSAWLRAGCAWLAMAASCGAAAAEGGMAALAGYLDESGHLALPEGFSGRLDPAGFTLVSGKGEAPRFAPVAKAGTPGARWAGEFRSPNGCENVYAMLVAPSGEIYLGGGFSSC